MVGTYNLDGQSSDQVPVGGPTRGVPSGGVPPHTGCPKGYGAVVHCCTRTRCPRLLCTKHGICGIGTRTWCSRLLHADHGVCGWEALYANLNVRGRRGRRHQNQSRGSRGSAYLDIVVVRASIRNDRLFCWTRRRFSATPVEEEKQATAAKTEEETNKEPGQPVNTVVRGLLACGTAREERTVGERRHRTGERQCGCRCGCWNRDRRCRGQRGCGALRQGWALGHGTGPTCSQCQGGSGRSCYGLSETLRCGVVWKGRSGRVPHDDNQRKDSIGVGDDSATMAIVLQYHHIQVVRVHLPESGLAGIWPVLCVLTSEHRCTGKLVRERECCSIVHPYPRQSCSHGGNNAGP